MNEKYGFIFVEFYKDYYFPGHVVRGHVIVDLFNPIKNKNFVIRLVGKEYLGKYT